MRTSLNNIKTIDDYLLGYMPTADKLLFEANIILNDDLESDIAHQRLTHETIRQYGRQKIKAEIISAQQKLAAAPQHRDFMQRIVNLFKKH
ncbi:hypothetical protein GCM10023149_28330 [Mucilaginibacter gynuensis]|uniref:Uncharacterized protein n=1 Tax=Mucilaginibacter gynuensis TaxID=1302236 RepID=A0ABP8GK40_9SPHI